MSFTATYAGAARANIAAQPSPPTIGNYTVEIWSYVNTGGSTGGTITAQYLQQVEYVLGSGITTRSLSTNTTTITTAANASGDVLLFGQQR